MIIKKTIKYLSLGFIVYFFINFIRIYNYSKNYSEQNSDVAIILGAGTSNGNISPVFKERLNHGIYLYKNNVVKQIIITGGFGKNQTQSDSYCGKNYCISKGVYQGHISIEEKSNYTHENLFESKQIMDHLILNSALLVSDAPHMLRSIKIANHYQINCQPSPTKTSMYKSNWEIFKFLIYETIFFTFQEILYIFI